MRGNEDRRAGKRGDERQSERDEKEREGDRGRKHGQLWRWPAPHSVSPWDHLL